MLEIIFALFIAWKIYEFYYFRSSKFLTVKESITIYINNCNELNKYIEKLKRTYLGINQLDYGSSNYYDNSLYKYKRPELAKQQYAPNVYNCSRTVCDNSRKQPFKYICKYFNIKAEEESLIKFEKVLNNFEAVEQGKIALKNEKERILNNINDEIPFLIRKLSSKKLSKKLGFEDVDFSTVYFPRFVFSYISSGGYSSMGHEIVMDINNLNRFITYLSEVIKFRKSVAGQRALMTSSLRQKILVRDNYTCQICGNSTYKEKNLLLEVDHIIPLSQGGITSEKNLQTLCWKCNRTKGKKILQSDNKETDIPQTNHAMQMVTNRTLSDRKKTVSEEPKQNVVKAEEIVEQKDEGKKNMYDKEKGIYPSGQYLVGRDLPLGGYILTAKSEETAYVQLYPSYAKYKKEEDAITYDSFDEDYHIALMEEDTFLVVEKANIHKI